MAARGIVQLAPGDVFASDFRIVKPLSEGGMGAVYVVEQLSTGKQRALKLMLPNLVADVKLRQRFEQEARVGARIESEHVIEVVGAGVDAATGAPWLAMELLQGEDLSGHVRSRGALPLDEVRRILEELCHAIGAAHAAGIVHRDLKPENIFLAKTKRAGVQSTVKVLDFGIAKIAAEAKTTATEAIGSPMWMAPEQTARGGAIGPQTDVWAIGLIAFHLLTGRFYWRSAEEESGTLANLIREIVLDPMPAASARAAEVGCGGKLPPGFDAWFVRAVDRDPRQRFANANEALSAFESGCGGGPVRAPARPTQKQGPLSAAPTMDDPVIAGARLRQTVQGSGTIVPGRGSTTGGIADVSPRPTRGGGAIVFASLGALALVLGAGVWAMTREPHSEVPNAEPLRAAIPAPGSSTAPTVPPPLQPLAPASSSSDVRVASPVTAVSGGAATGAARRLSSTTRPSSAGEGAGVGSTGTPAGRPDSTQPAVPAFQQPAAPAPEFQSSAPFDRGAAAAALGSVNVQGCKTPDGPTGSGHVKITFAPNGGVATAVADTTPYYGTAVGRCVEAKFRGAHIPMFGGGPVTVYKTFTIE